MLLSVPFSGCASRSRERLAADVGRYLRAMQGWAPVEVETGGTIKRILATQFVDDAEVMRQLAESRPRIERHLHELRAYHPDTPAVRTVHQEYIESWVALLRGYADLEHGLEDVDAAEIAKGRDALLAWRRHLREVAADLRALADETGAHLPEHEGPA
jgi:hypothetical protein